jgi:hypothetical protein
MKKPLNIPHHLSHSFTTHSFITQNVKMRLTLLPVACLLGSAIAAPLDLVERDTAVIERAIARVTRSTTRLDQALRSLPRGGSTQEADRYTNDLLAMGREVIEDLHLGSREIRRGPMVSPMENVKILDSVDALTKWLQSAMSGWVNAKTMVVAAGRKATVLDHLMSTSEAAASFGEVWVSKLPVTYKALAVLVKDRHQVIIEVAVREYRK